MEKVIEVIKYFIECKNVNETISKYNISRRTFTNYVKKLGEVKDNSELEKIYNVAKGILKDNQKTKPSVDIKLVLEIATYIIKNNATSKEASTKFNLSEETIENYMNVNLKEYCDLIDDKTIKLIYSEVKRVKENNSKNTQFKSKKVGYSAIINDLINSLMPLEVLAKRYGISEKTISNYINTTLKEENYLVYKQVKKAQMQIILLGNRVGGKYSKRGKKNTDFEALEIAKTMVDNSYTLDDASMFFDVPRSTIYDIVTKIQDEQLSLEIQNLFKQNKSR